MVKHNSQPTGAGFLYRRERKNRAQKIFKNLGLSGTNVSEWKKGTGLEALAEQAFIRTNLEINKNGKNKMHKREITVIIPTIGACKDITLELIHSIEDFVDEIILIDNERKFNKKEFSDNVLVLRKNNLFVNPAWQKGIDIARNEICLLLNDDILFNHNNGELFDEIIFELNNNIFGILGMNQEKMTFFMKREEIPGELDYEGFYVEKLDKKRPKNWGTFMALKKQNFIKIPEGLEIWFGDDIQFNFAALKENYAKNVGMMSFKWYHRESSSSCNPALLDKQKTETEIFDYIITSLNTKLNQYFRQKHAQNNPR